MSRNTNTSENLQCWSIVNVLKVRIETMQNGLTFWHDLDHDRYTFYLAEIKNLINKIKYIENLIHNYNKVGKLNLVKLVAFWRYYADERINELGESIPNLSLNAYKDYTTIADFINRGKNETPSNYLLDMYTKYTLKLIHAKQYGSILNVDSFIDMNDRVEKILNDYLHANENQLNRVVAMNAPLGNESIVKPIQRDKLIGQRGI